MRVRGVLLVSTIVAALLGTAAPADANHPVYVEGNCDSPVPGTTLVTVAGTCGDYDGDGRIGTAEDTDGADRIFGTLNAALGPGAGAAAGTGINQNGTIIIVASGRFAEQLTIGATADTPNPGNVTIEAIPGVTADIDAVLQGDPAGGNNTRQDGAGIYIKSPGQTRVIVRNLEVRNFRNGIRITGGAHATLENVRLSNNRDHGIVAEGKSRVAIIDCSVTATGFRVGPAINNTPSPGVGIEFKDDARGLIHSTTVTGSFAAGIKDSAAGTAFKLSHNRLFDNVPNLVSG